MSKEKKICLMHLSGRPGGAEVLIPGIIKGIPEYKFESFVIRPSEPGSRSVYEGMDHIITYGSNLNLKAILKIFFYARQNKTALFHVWGIGPLFLLILRLAGIRKIIYAIHGTIYWKQKWKKPFLKALWWLAIDKRYIFTSNSEYSKDVFKSATGRKINIKVLYNPINTDIFHPATSRESDLDTLKIIYCGRLVEGKGLFRWVDAANSIKKEFKNVNFEIWGEGPLSHTIKDYIIKSGSDSYIKLMGFTNNIGDTYRSADLLLFLSEYESFGNVVVECILCGTPVLATALPSIKEVCINYQDFLIPPDSADDEVILSAVRNLNHLRNLTIKAAEEFSARFSSRVHFEKLIVLYDNIYS